MERDETSAWLRLLLTPRVGPTSARRLLAALGSPQAVFTATKDALLGVVSAREANELLKVPADLAEHLTATLAWLEAAPPGQGRALITLGDERYPASLLETADPPFLLFAQGRLELLRSPGVAIVGSRNPTAQGKENAQAFAQALSLAGITVVSGLALGIDGAAHEGALAGTLGSTIAVVGTGLDRVYPKAHHDLAHRIAQQGLLISEFTLGTPPLSANFPKRNRIVAGLTRGTLVVEAAVQSGSLITARLAMEMGREVLAIPGSIHSPQARGCHALIKQGAKLVETVEDILMELPAFAGVLATLNRPPRLSPLEQTLLGHLGSDPITEEEIVEKTRLPASAVTRALVGLKSHGLVKSRGGGFVKAEEVRSE